MVKPRRRFNVPLSILLASCTLLGLGALELVRDGEASEETLAQPAAELSLDECEVIPLPHGRLVRVSRAAAQPRAAVLPSGAGSLRAERGPSSRAGSRSSTCL